MSRSTGLKPYPVLCNDDIDAFNETILAACLKRGLASPQVQIETDAEVADFLEYQEGYVLGVYLKALDIKPLAAMHKVDPADAPPVPICMVTLKGQESEKLDRLNSFVMNEFPLMKRMFNEAARHWMPDPDNDPSVINSVQDSDYHLHCGAEACSPCRDNFCPGLRFSLARGEGSPPLDAVGEVEDEALGLLPAQARVP